MSTPRIQYYELKGEGRNAGIHVVMGNWPARVLEHRGLTHDRQVWSRDATAEETEEISASTRCLVQRYDDAESLLEDERRILAAHPTELHYVELALRNRRAA